MAIRATSSSTGTVGNQIVAAMRLVLAASALFITFVDPSQPERLVAVTYGTLALYTLYSAVLYGLTLLSEARTAPLDRWAHWIDIAWYIVLIALSNGTSSIFFFGFFFAIMVASFQWGFGSGLRATLVSVLLFTSVGLATSPQGSGFELNRTLVRPIYILVLGYMVAYWGGHEITLKRRLGLLREVGTLANPRFGVDRTIGLLLERLRAFYNADACLLITSDPDGAEFQLRRAGRADAESATRATALPAAVAEQLLALPAHQALVYRRRTTARWLRREAEALDVRTCESERADPGIAAVLAETLEAPALLTVPVRSRDEAASRLFLTGTCARFDLSDADLLLQVFEQVTPVIDNIRLVDRLASDAAEQERQRIARDLHDSVIQPYIGLQLGINAMERKYSGQRGIGDDLARLAALTSEGIAELRGYVRQLRTSGEPTGNLEGAIGRFATKFAAATGISVDVHTSGDVRCNDRLGAEVFQMVAEGLSNIRRHTEAHAAAVDLQRRDDQLVLRIVNPQPDGAEPVRFTPRSITERAAALGGSARVEQQPDTGTAVVINIPL